MNAHLVQNLLLAVVFGGVLFLIYENRGLEGKILETVITTTEVMNPLKPQATKESTVTCKIDGIPVTTVVTTTQMPGESNADFCARHTANVQATLADCD